MKEKILVMGGSFNPPTIAHYRLMKHAITAIGAAGGIFVPVSHAYLQRKMRKAESPLCLGEDLRMRMLLSMCGDDHTLRVCDCEYRNPTWNTPMTMTHLQSLHPDAELYFLAGMDKLKLFRLLSERHAFLDHFKVAIVDRGTGDAMKAIAQDEHLRCHLDAFLPVPSPDDLEAVSSTAIRRAFLHRELTTVRASLHDRVWEIMAELSPADYPPHIEKFKGEYGFLSNGYPCPIRYRDLTYRSAEAAFLAARCQDPADRKRFTTCDAGGARAIAAHTPPRVDFASVQLSLMEEILREKFAQNPALIERLLATENAVLIFGNSVDETFWGMDLYSAEGDNHLGELLMKLRREYRAVRT